MKLAMFRSLILQLRTDFSLDNVFKVKVNSYVGVSTYYV